MRGTPRLVSRLPRGLRTTLPVRQAAYPLAEGGGAARRVTYGERVCGQVRRIDSVMNFPSARGSAGDLGDRGQRGLRKGFATVTPDAAGSGTSNRYENYTGIGLPWPCITNPITGLPLC